jgi:hypothetical protein
VIMELPYDVDLIIFKLYSCTYNNLNDYHMS